MRKTFEQARGDQEIGEGARLLHDLEKTGKYVFHGSSSPDISELEPRQAYDYPNGIQQKHGHPCVAASQFADIAIFRALVTANSTQFGQRRGEPYFCAASQEAFDAAKGKTGYVYVLPKSQFAPMHGDNGEFEWRAESNQKPVQIIAVTERDLPKNIEIINKYELPYANR